MGSRCPFHDRPHPIRRRLSTASGRLGHPHRAFLKRDGIAWRRRVCACGPATARTRATAHACRRRLDSHRRSHRPPPIERSAERDWQRSAARAALSPRARTLVCVSAYVRVCSSVLACMHVDVHKHKYTYIRMPGAWRGVMEPQTCLNIVGRCRGRRKGCDTHTCYIYI